MPALNFSFTVDYRPDQPQHEIDELTYAQGFPLPDDEHSVAMQRKSLLESCSDSIRAFGISLIGYYLIIVNFFNFAYHATVNDFFEILAIINDIIGYYYHIFVNHLTQTYHYILHRGAMMITAPWNGFIFYLTTFLFIIIAMILTSNDHPTILPWTTTTPILLNQLHQDLDLFFLNLQAPESGNFFCLPSRSIAPQSSSSSDDDQDLPFCSKILKIRHKTYEDLSLSILWRETTTTTTTTTTATTAPSSSSSSEFLRQDFLQNLLPKYLELLIKVGAILDNKNNNKSLSKIASAIKTFYTKDKIQVLEPGRVFSLDIKGGSGLITEFEEMIILRIWRILEESWGIVVWAEGVQ